MFASRSVYVCEPQHLNSTDFSTSESNETPDSKQVTTTLAALPEQLTYENLSEKSHLLSLRDQLRFMFNPALRQSYEAYIHEQAGVAGHKTLVTKNLHQASNLTIANLYYYFKIRNGSETEKAEVLEARAV
ncbi:hypothetical protein H6G95_34165 [Nostoc linckia FACHB-391]|uniref:Uncharacterized protein n=1 Tax=Nostoc linckia FACHB-391 TaxID=2692906 RepID=A0ABR8F7P0_NOSLI|nr:hypothetical protein [Nostoc linckia]MBD2565523.1 hypothetical protein [Nostoc linckia FACHB-391]